MWRAVRSRRIFPQGCWPAETHVLHRARGPGRGRSSAGSPGGERKVKRGMRRIDVDDRAMYTTGERCVGEGGRLLWRRTKQQGRYDLAFGGNGFRDFLKNARYAPAVLRVAVRRGHVGGVPCKPLCESDLPGRRLLAVKRSRLCVRKPLKT